MSNRIFKNKTIVKIPVNASFSLQLSVFVYIPAIFSVLLNTSLKSTGYFFDPPCSHITRHVDYATHDMLAYYSSPGTVVLSIVVSVSVCVSASVRVLQHVRHRTSELHHIFCVQLLTCDSRDSVLLWRHCYVLPVLWMASNLPTVGCMATCRHRCSDVAAASWRTNASVASYWLLRVLAGAVTSGVHRTRGAGGEACNAPLGYWWPVASEL